MGRSFRPAELEVPGGPTGGSTGGRPVPEMGLEVREGRARQGDRGGEAASSPGEAGLLFLGGHLMPLDLAAGVIISHILVRGQLAERWAQKGEEKGRAQRRWGIGLG